MREFSQTLSEFTKGLRPDANTPRNSGFATELYNSRCGVAGLEVPPLIVYPISGTPAVSWPLPQLIKIKDITTGGTDLIFLSSTNPQYAYKVNADYSITAICTGSGTDPINLSTPGLYTVADFGWYQLFHKLAMPTNILERYFDSDDGAWYWRKYTGGGELPTYANITCICNFRGRLIAGLLTATSGTDGTKGYAVVWSRIGTVDRSMMLKASGDHIDRDATADYNYMRTSGNYRIGPNSVIHRILPLGNGVMVYCSDRIFYMKQVVSPEPTFGIVSVAGFGIPSTFAVAGDEDEHCFVDSYKNLWKVQAGQKPKYLGYREFITTLGTIVMSKNSNLDDYYISDGVKTYLLSPYGLSQWFQYPTSLVWEDTNKRLIGPIAVAADVTAYMASDTLDFGTRGIKTIMSMEIGSSGQTPTANVDYKYKVTDSAFTSSAFKTASPAGTVSPIVSGVELRVRVKGADYTKFDLDYVNVRYKYVDKRIVRGAYATDAKVLSRTGR